MSVVKGILHIFEPPVSGVMQLRQKRDQKRE